MWGRSVLENFRGVLADDDGGGGGGGGGRGVKRRQLLLWPMMISWYCRARGWELADGMESRNTPATRGWQFLKRLVQRRKGGTPDMGRKYLSSFFGALGAVLFLPLSVFPFSRSLLTHYSWYVLWGSVHSFTSLWLPFFFTPLHTLLLWTFMVQLQKIKIRSTLDFSSSLYFRSHIALPWNSSLTALNDFDAIHLHLSFMPIIFICMLSTTWLSSTTSTSCCVLWSWLISFLSILSLIFFFPRWRFFIRQFFLTFFFVPSGFLFIFLW